MAIAQVEPTCVVWFFTSRESAKVCELGDDDRVQVICQDDHTFVSIAGAASIVDARAKIDELWNERLRAWFPRGKDDPNLVLIAVTPIDGEYWDNKGVKGVRYAFEEMKAIAKNLFGRDERPHMTPDLHGKADLR
jgi:general stress protein 26